MPIRTAALLSTCALGIGLVPPAVAQSQPTSKPRPARAADPYHQPTSPEIVVTAPLRQDRQDILSGVAVLQGAELTQQLRPTIGETLAKTPGVSATSFGPNASRPVLRGLQGQRVGVLTDGIGSIDVSNTSVDHAVVIDPLLADRIEVLRGPEALLYGSEAVGGVVNVIDKRIPRAVPDEPIHLDAIGTYGSAANERSFAGSADAPVGDKLVVHADGSYTKTDDLKIGGYVLSPSARREALASAASDPGDPIDFAGNAALRGTLPNTASKTWTAGVGAAVITETGNLGFSYSHYDSFYGVPVRYATAPGEEEEAPRLDLAQDRLDARAEIETGGQVLQSIKARLGYASYRHFELAQDGGIDTAFYNKGLEGRVDLVQADHGALKGSFGAQFSARDFDVVGDEAFLPKNRTEQGAVFALERLDFGRIKAEGSLRYEHSTLAGLPLPDQPQFFDGTRSFDAVSGSIGASYGFSDAWRLGGNVSRTERAPTAEELFANGPHGGTEAFEIGNPGFGLEKSTGIDAVLRGRGRGYTLELSAYYNWFSNYIYEAETGVIEDGLPVFQSYQGKARYWGFEAQGSLDLAKFGAATLKADALADYVHATITDFGPAPRIPPLRVQGGFGVTTPKVDGRVEVEWDARQNRTGPIETPTPSFTLLNAELDIRPWGTEKPLSFALSANNLLDVDARRAASFLKDFAPLPGRDFRVTARVSF